MLKRLRIFYALAVSALLWSCNSLDIPPAPNLEPVLHAYESPTAVVGSTIMASVADEIAEAAAEIQDSEIYAEILELIIEVQKELEAASDENGNLVLDATCSGGINDGNACATDPDCPDGTCGGGVVFPSPSGGIRVAFICPGWDERQFEEDYEEEPDPANGTIDLTMTLDGGGIGRVAWGTAVHCLYLVPGEGQNFQASYDGGVAVDLGDPVPPGEDITQLLVTFVVEGNIGFDGGDYRINQSFRVVLADSEGLAILVDLGEPALAETFIYEFQESRQAITDSTGTFGCSLEDSECFDQSGILFSW